VRYKTKNQTGTPDSDHLSDSENSSAIREGIAGPYSPPTCVCVCEYINIIIILSIFQPGKNPFN
jgi:hypothetical protein